MDDNLLHLLQCPETGERLIRGEKANLVSERTGRQWQVVHGRPVFLPNLDDLVVYPDTHLSNPLPPAAHEVFSTTREPVLHLSGGGTHQRYDHVIELEYGIYRHTDVVGDVHRLPFGENCFFSVVSLNAVEHYRAPETAIAEIRRVLRPGGMVLIHTAFMQPLHGAPHHYYNCTKFGASHWMRDFEVKAIHVSDNFNPLFSLAWLAHQVANDLQESVSAEAVQLLREVRVGDLVDLWCSPEKVHSSVPEKIFFDIPRPIQERTAAGFEIIAYKKR